ncbi:MAG: flippase-like domain-containing protein [Bacteroidales bacterium]|nr:flippase-like domain-containing protein [Bacteroidales bacterium]
MQKKLKVAFQIAFSLALGGFFIWFFVRRLEPEQINEIWDAFRRADYGWLIAAFFIGIASHWMRAVRSILLLEPMGYKPKRGNAFFATIIGYLANLAVPRLGEVLRCSTLAQYEKIPVSKSFGTVITERVIDMAIYLLLFLIVLLFFSADLYQYAETTFLSSFLQKVSLLRLAGIMVAGAVVMVLAYFLVLRKKILKYTLVQKAESFVKGIWTGLKSIAQLKRPITFSIETLLIWILYYAGFYICFFSLPETAVLTPDAALAAMAFATIGGILVQGGIGLYPLFVAGTLAVYGVAEPVGYALGWLAWGAQQVAVVLAGIFSIIYLPYYNQKRDGKISSHQVENL